MNQRLSVVTVLGAVFAVAVYGAFFGATRVDDLDWVVYTNEEHHYSFRYPVDWTLKVGPTMCGADGFCVQHTEVKNRVGNSVRAFVNFQGDFCTSGRITHSSIEMRGHSGTEWICRGSEANPKETGFYTIGRNFDGQNVLTNMVVLGDLSPGQETPDTTTLDRIVRSFWFSEFTPGVSTFLP